MFRFLTAPLIASRHVLSGVVTVLVAVASVQPTYGGFLPDSPESMLQRFEQVVTARERSILLGLYHWAGVDGETRGQIETQVNELLAMDIESIELRDVPLNIARMAGDNSGYAMNVRPEKLVYIKYKGKNGSLSAGLPIGRTEEGYAFAVTVETSKIAPVTQAVVDAPKKAAAAPGPVSADFVQVEPVVEAPTLFITVDAPEGVTTEIACAWMQDGERKVETWRGEGPFEYKVAGETFETCAAKKRSGKRASRVTLREGAKVVFNELAPKVDEAVVYMRQ